MLGVVLPEIARGPAASVTGRDWQRRAACRAVDPGVFFHPDGERHPSRERRVARARQVCATCPVISECRAWAHGAREAYGVWGGESEDERRHMLARRRRQTTPHRPAA